MKSNLIALAILISAYQSQAAAHFEDLNTSFAAGTPVTLAQLSDKAYSGRCFEPEARKYTDGSIAVAGPDDATGALLKAGLRRLILK